ncbi:MAG: hypothetical protein VKJ02_12980 [Snowella sp.]|nr:hypothetical protein [Snowella sp.]
MTALPKQFPPKLTSASQKAPATPQRIASTRRMRSQKPSSAPPIHLPQNPLPTGLQFLLRFQQATSVMTFGLVGVALAVYALSVYTPRTWSHEYKKLRSLQNNERQLVATNEILKNQLAQQAEKPNSGFVRPNPNYNIFLPSSPATVKRVANASEPPTDLILNQKPLAY